MIIKVNVHQIVIAKQDQCYFKLIKKIYLVGEIFGRKLVLRFKIKGKDWEIYNEIKIK